MKKKGMLLLSIVAAMVFPASVYAGVPCVPPSPTPNPGPGINNMMASTAHNAYTNALELKEKAHSLLDQAMEQELDVEEIEEAIEKADALLEKAQKILRVNPIPANNMAREAAQLYENAISDLEALLG